MTEAVVLLACISEISGSRLGRETNDLEVDFFMVFVNPFCHSSITHPVTRPKYFEDIESVVI